MEANSQYAGNWLARVLAIANGLLLFLVLARLWSLPHAGNLDYSWTTVLTWAATHHAQWGRDLVFTYGPLGFLESDMRFNPGTYPVWLPLHLCMAAIFAWMAVAALTRMHWTAGLAFMLTCVVLVAGIDWIQGLVSYPLALILIGRIAQGVKSSPSLKDYVATSGLAGFEALFPLMKFSVFPLWLLWIPAALFTLSGARNAPLRAVFAAASVIAPLAVWLASGQHLANYPIYLHRSLEIAVYYGGAMQAGPSSLHLDAYAMCGLLVALACFAYVVAKRPGRLAVWASASLSAGALVLAYKAGMTRVDGGHILIFFGSAALTVILTIGNIETSPARKPWYRSALILMLMLFPLVLVWSSDMYSSGNRRIMFSGIIARSIIYQALQQIFNPIETYDSNLADWKSLQKSLALPEIAAIVGNGSVDMLMSDQDLVTANGFNYRPRPIFQSYSAYSPRLAKANERFYLSRGAPDWVILDLQTIDGHYPASEDAKSLVRIFQFYRPILRENDLLLMQRDGGLQSSRLTDGKNYETENLSFDHPVSVPNTHDKIVFATFDVGLTCAGRLQTLLFREPILRVQVATTTQHSLRYRMIRAVAKSGIVLSPLIGLKSYLGWLKDFSYNRVISVQLMQSYFLGQPVFKVDSPIRFYPVELNREHGMPDFKK